jgi:hypothetical protein
MAGVHTGTSRWDTHKALVSRENHLEFLKPGKGLARVARPTQIKAQRQALEKQLANVQGRLAVVRVDERHASENKQKPTGKR